jgi:hypothetical protein
LIGAFLLPTTRSYAAHIAGDERRVLVLKTDEQRRWWFANNPEYSAGRKGKRKQRQEERGESSKVSPEEVDEYVDNALQYVDEDAADLLKSFKKHFGTEAAANAAAQQTAGEATIERELERSRRVREEDSKGIEADPITFLDVAPIGRFITAPVSALKSFLRSLARGSVVNATKRKGNHLRTERRRGKSPRESEDGDSHEVIAGGDIRHQNAAIGESHGYQELLKEGHISIKAPGKVTTTGPDYMTYNPKSGRITIGESKYRGPKGGWIPKSLPAGKLEKWMKTKIEKIILEMPPSPDKDAIVRALKNGEIDVIVYRHPPKKKPGK